MQRLHADSDLARRCQFLVESVAGQGDCDDFWFWFSKTAKYPLTFFLIQEKIISQANLQLMHVLFQINCPNNIPSDLWPVETDTGYKLSQKSRSVCEYSQNCLKVQ